VYCNHKCNDPEGGTAHGTTAGINVTTGLDAGTNAMAGGVLARFPLLSCSAQNRIGVA
jgi:hypothetical protein